MCYYSRTMDHREFRDAKENENLVVGLDNDQSHTVARAESDGKVVCVISGTDIHVEKLVLQRSDLNPTLMAAIAPHLGKPYSGKFVEYQSHGKAADAIWIAGYRFHLAWLKLGTKFYIGAKRPSMETRLGVDDPSIALDHREETPTVARAFARVVGLCSITR